MFSILLNTHIAGGSYTVTLSPGALLLFLLYIFYSLRNLWVVKPLSYGLFCVVHHMARGSVGPPYEEDI